MEDDLSSVQRWLAKQEGLRVVGGAEGGHDAANAVRAEKLPREVAEAMAKEIERKMRDAAANLEFEKAAALRDELVNLLAPLVGHPLAVGLDLSIYDPALDADRSGARRLVGLLEQLVSSVK